MSHTKNDGNHDQRPRRNGAVEHHTRLTTRFETLIHDFANERIDQNQSCEDNSEYNQYWGHAETLLVFYVQKQALFWRSSESRVVRSAQIIQHGVAHVHAHLVKRHQDSTNRATEPRRNQLIRLGTDRAL